NAGCRGAAAGGAVEGGQGDPGWRCLEERRRVLGTAVDPVAEVDDAGGVAGPAGAGLTEDRAPPDGPPRRHPYPAEVGVGRAPGGAAKSRPRWRGPKGLRGGSNPRTRGPSTGRDHPSGPASPAATGTGTDRTRLTTMASQWRDTLPPGGATNRPGGRAGGS